MNSKQMMRDTQMEFQARFQAKQARREAVKASKEGAQMERQIQDLLRHGDTARAYQKARVLLTKQALARQLDQVADMAELGAAQIQANAATSRMTAMMNSSSRIMSAAQRNTNPERTLATMEQYKTQNEEYAMSNAIYQDAMMQSSSAQVSEDAVGELLGRLADSAGIDLKHELGTVLPSDDKPVSNHAEPSAAMEQEGKLQERLRALRS